MKNKEIEELLNELKDKYSYEPYDTTGKVYTTISYEEGQLLLSYIEQLKKKAELGEHYKHLYSEVKKQKDDVVEYIKYQLSNLDFKKEEDMKAKMLGSMILVMLEDKRMLGEIE